MWYPPNASQGLNRLWEDVSKLQIIHAQRCKGRCVGVDDCTHLVVGIVGGAVRRKLDADVLQLIGTGIERNLGDVTHVEPRFVGGPGRDVDRVRIVRVRREVPTATGDHATLPQHPAVVADEQRPQLPTHPGARLDEPSPHWAEQEAGLAQPDDQPSGIAD